MSNQLSELIQAAEQLTTKEQLRLIAHLAQSLSTQTQEQAEPKMIESSEKSVIVLDEMPEAPEAETLLELIDRLTADMTEEEIAQLPKDGAEQHDHSI